MLDQGELPTWNSYHMGGEPLATPPGFHYFVTTLILLAGMPIILAELITAAFYSSIIIFPAYLVSKRIWKNCTAGLIAAFFASISALSLEMISWGGYTNIVSLLLIVIIFYLFLKYTQKPSSNHLLMGGLLFGSLIFTHTFSLFVLAPILLLYFILLLIGKTQKLKDLKIKNTVRYFAASIIVGVAGVLPWILRVLSFYIGASSEGIISGGLEDNKNLILANRTVETVIVSLVVVIIPTLLMLKASRKKYVDRHGLLLISWFLIPVIFTQAYLFGIFVDYSRFMYFIDFPGIVIISAGLFYLFRYVIIVAKKSSRIRKTLPTISVSAILFIFIIITPWSIFPQEAIKRAEFYTAIHEPEAFTLDWIKNMTPEDSVLVADHLFGWWLSGIGKRTTLSAAGLEFLIYPHELKVAKAAHLLFDTNYYIDNGLIQVREDGLYLLKRNPEFSVKRINDELIPVLNFQDNGTLIYYEYFDDFGQKAYADSYLSDMKIVQQFTQSNDENSANLTMIYQNEFSTIKKTVTVCKGSRFAQISFDVDVNSQVNLYNIWLPIYYRDGNMTKFEKDMMFRFYDSSRKVCGQVIFEGDSPVQMDLKTEPNRIELLYRYPWESCINIEILIGVFDAENLSLEQINQRFIEMLNSPQQTVTTDQVFSWNYIDMIEEYNITHIVCRDQSVYTKFSRDPNFRLLFNCRNTAIFQVLK